MAWSIFPHGLLNKQCFCALLCVCKSVHPAVRCAVLHNTQQAPHSHALEAGERASPANMALEMHPASQAKLSRPE